LLAVVFVTPPLQEADDYIGTVKGVADGDIAVMIEGKQVHCLQLGLGTPAMVGRWRPTATASSRNASWVDSAGKPASVPLLRMIPAGRRAAYTGVSYFAPK
jgi:hypothetical protein